MVFFLRITKRSEAWMSKRRGFSLLEMVIALCIIGLLIAAGVMAYRSHVEKARSSEAVITANKISQAEEIHKIENGTYVAADSTQQVNERLGMQIITKDFEYRVVNVTEDNFIVIAQRIGLDAQTGRIPEAPMVLAMSRSGMLPQGGGYQPYSGGAAGEGQIIHSPPGFGSGGGAGMGGGGGSVTRTDDNSGGSGYTQPSGGTSGGVGGGGGGGGSASRANLPVYDSILADSLALLRGSATGKYYYDLIVDNDITYEFGETADNALGQWDGTKIVIRANLHTLYPESAIAAVIAHEATHADYDLNPDRWIASTLAAHPELTRDDLHIDVEPYYSLDQEYHCFETAVLVWRQTKQAGDECGEMDAEDALYSQGEAYMKADIADRYGERIQYDY